MSHYTYQKRPGQRAAGHDAAKPALQSAVPNSAALSQVQERAQAQIPAAEAEADRLSASVSSGGPEAVKAAIGRRLGADFSGVRFHTGETAEAKASAMDARAYTSGADIYFGAGGFDPAVAAHELVHTVQQGAVAAATPTMSTPMGGVQQWPSRKQKKQQQQAAQRNKALAGDRSNIDAIAKKDAGFYQGTLIPQVRAGMVASLANNPINFSLQRQPGQLNPKYAAADIQRATDQLFPDTGSLLDPVKRDALRSNPGAFGLNASQVAAIEDEMNHRAIAASMQLPDAAARGRLSPDEALMAEQAGRNMAHIMFGMQLGKVKINSTNAYGATITQSYGAGQSYDPSMASLISNGGRTTMNFGKTSSTGTSANDVYRSMMELTRGDGKDVAHRTKTTRPFATHHISGDSMTEKKGFLSAAGALLDPTYKHRGFNPAIGGAGRQAYETEHGAHQPGDPKATIKANGQSGHMYMGVQDSSSSRSGGMMVGLETSQAQMYNLAGKFHDAKASSALFSPTGSRKDARIGGDANGREVDLTNISMDENVYLQEMLTRRMDTLANAAHSGDAQAMRNYNDMMYKLSGSKLSPVDLAKLLDPNLFGQRVSRGEAQRRQALIDMIRRAQGR